MIVLGSMVVVTVVVAVSAVTGIVRFVTRESRQSQVSSKNQQKRTHQADFDRYGETESFRIWKLDREPRRKFWQMRSFSQYNMIMTRQSACFRNTVAIKEYRNAGCGKTI